MDIRKELMEDFDRINKRMVKYNQGLKTMQSDNLPPCFVPVVDPDKLQVIVWSMGQLLDCIREALNEEE
jgi:hypothetical protein